MINFLTGYIKNIATFLIFITLIGIISPSNKYKNYINLILGFILIFVIVSPIMQIFNNNNLSVDNLILKMTLGTEKSDLSNKGGLLNEQDELILKKYISDLEKQVISVLKNEKKYQVQNVDVEVSKDKEHFGEIQKIKLILSENIKPPKESLVRIEKVIVNKKPIVNTDISNEDIEKIKKLISDFYNLSAENIYLTVQKNDKE